MDRETTKETTKNSNSSVDAVVESLSRFADLFDLPHLFLMGGYPRHLYYEKPCTDNRLDVVCAYDDLTEEMANLFASEILGRLPSFKGHRGDIIIKTSDDEPNIELHFQSYSPNSHLYNPDLKNHLAASEADTIPIMHNAYGRDFTVDTLAYALDDGYLYDPTGRASRDLKDKKLDSMLSPETLFKFCPKAAFRALNLALDEDLDISPRLGKGIRSAIPRIMAVIPENERTRNAIRTIVKHREDGLDLLKKYNLDRFLINDKVKNILKQEAKGA